MSSVQCSGGIIRRGGRQSSERAATPAIRGARVNVHSDDQHRNDVDYLRAVGRLLRARSSAGSALMADFTPPGSPARGFLHRSAGVAAICAVGCTSSPKEHGPQPRPAQPRRGFSSTEKNSFNIV